MQVQLKILDERVLQYPPSYATPGSAGLDLRAMLDPSNPYLTIKPNETVLIHTGMVIYLENPNYAAMLIPRSGLGVKHGIVLSNLIGLIDSDYQGELKVALWNRSQQDYLLHAFERIAQLVIVPVVHAQFNMVNEFKPSQRGESGFGSTGTK